MPNVRLLTFTPDPERLIEYIGRKCYNSKFHGGEEGRKFIRNIVSNGHTSVIEHASATFEFSGISRAMSHQLVRHRIASFTQSSQRYIDQTGFDGVVPPSISGNEKAELAFKEAKKRANEDYKTLREMGIPKEDARYVLPNMCETTVVMSADFQEWRHVIELRCDKHAQWEIRDCMMVVLDILNGLAPSVFGDLHKRFFDDQKEDKE